MSLEHGMAALNLEMPPRVPRTEYSAENHWELISAVTGLPVGPESPGQERDRARAEFYRRWNYDLHWATGIGGAEFGELRTSMGHAAYAAGGTDLNREKHCPFGGPDEVLEFDPREAYGPRDRAELVRRFEESYAARAAARPEAVNMTGIYVTLVSGLIDIFGWELLLVAAGTDPDRFGALAGRYAQWVAQYFAALAEADVPVVMIHDDIVWTSGPFIAPEWYRRYVFPRYREFIAPLRDSGKKVIFTSDGNYTEFVDDLVACGVHALVMEPTTDMKYVAERYGDRLAFVGNADTRVLLSGPKSAIRAEVARCMSIGKRCPGFFMAVGNHIPANTPVENALCYNRAYQELAAR
jgi:hypothetical protein